jgi:hypothetical protein
LPELQASPPYTTYKSQDALSKAESPWQQKPESKRLFALMETTSLLLPIS